MFGQKFECTEERINILKRFKLTQRFIDRQTIEFQHLIGHGHQPLFVVKGTQARFEEIRKMAMNIAKYYPFSKISIYNKDLNQTHTDEIRWWCNTEVAKFDKHKWPKAYLESKEHFDAMVVIVSLYIIWLAVFYYYKVFFALKNFYFYFFRMLITNMTLSS